MHYLIERLDTKRILDLIAPDALDLFHLFGVIVRHAPRELCAVDVTEADYLAPLELAIDRDDPGG